MAALRRIIQKMSGIMATWQVLGYSRGIEHKAGKAVGVSRAAITILFSLAGGFACPGNS
jgi:hypothetical protein